jgi:hypothetical protein
VTTDTLQRADSRSAPGDAPATAAAGSGASAAGARGDAVALADGTAGGPAACVDRSPVACTIQVVATTASATAAANPTPTAFELVATAPPPNNSPAHAARPPSKRASRSTRNRAIARRSRLSTVRTGTPDAAAIAVGVRSSKKRAWIVER